MLYSIQDRGGGRVYGIYDAPDNTPPLAPEDYVAELQAKYADTPGLTFHATPLVVNEQNDQEERFVITIDEWNTPDTIDIPDLHAAVGMISLEHEIDGDIPS